MQLHSRLWGTTLGIALRALIAGAAQPTIQVDCDTP
jgi:hypothetical protein